MITQIALLFFLVLCKDVHSEIDSRSRQKDLKLAYEAVEEGNDHEAAIASVEAGLGGNGENSDELQTVERESSALLNNLRQIIPVSRPEKQPVAISKDLLHDLKVEALARLEKKIRSELEKETAALGPIADPEDSPATVTAGHVYHVVHQELSALPWVRCRAALSFVLFMFLIFHLSFCRLRCFSCLLLTVTL